MSTPNDNESNTTNTVTNNIKTTSDASSIAVTIVAPTPATQTTTAATTTATTTTTLPVMITTTKTIDLTDSSINIEPEVTKTTKTITQIMANGENNGNATPTEQTTTTTVTTTTTQVITKGKMDSNSPAFANFRVLYILTQLCGLTMIVLVGSWVGSYMGGLGGTSNPALEFNWHPLMMTIGLLFLYGNSILIYRGFRQTRKQTLKWTHAILHLLAFILTVIALQTVFDSHNLAAKPIPNMYSLHSWLGLSAVILFCLQYVIGFITFLSPGLKESYKKTIMPLHIYFGLFGFVLAIASALMGLTEKAIFSIQNYAQLPGSGVMANLCGVSFVIFGGLVVYLVTEPNFKRKPLPEDTGLLNGINE